MEEKFYFENGYAEGTEFYAFEYEWPVQAVQIVLKNVSDRILIEYPNEDAIIIYSETSDAEWGRRSKTELFRIKHIPEDALIDIPYAKTLIKLMNNTKFKTFVKEYFRS